MATSLLLAVFLFLPLGLGTGAQDDLSDRRARLDELVGLPDLVHPEDRKARHLQLAFAQPLRYLKG